MIPLSEPPENLTLETVHQVDQFGAERPWTSTASAVTDFKLKFREWTHANQAGRCAFCRLPIGRGPRRTETLDHFAPKGQRHYPQWRFEPLNLLAVCGSCNSDIKKEFDPVQGAPGTTYRATAFTILHPYLDQNMTQDLSGGFDAIGGEPQLLEGLSPKGVATIDALGLDDPGILELWLQEWRATEWVREKALLAQLDQERFDEALEELSGSL